jgi:hypothetical protein
MVAYKNYTPLSIAGAIASFLTIASTSTAGTDDFAFLRVLTANYLQVLDVHSL